MVTINIALQEEGTQRNSLSYGDLCHNKESWTDLFLSNFKGTEKIYLLIEGRQIQALSDTFVSGEEAIKSLIAFFE